MIFLLMHQLILFCASCATVIQMMRAMAALTMIEGGITAAALTGLMLRRLDGQTLA
jgi:hypothetical protein